MLIRRLVLLMLMLANYSAFALIIPLKIGRFRYDVRPIKNQYLHDDRVYASYFAVYRHGSNKRECSAFSMVTKNGKTLLFGSMTARTNFLEFKTHSVDGNHYLSADSTTERFYPDQHGRLKLRELIEFSNGKPQITRF